MITHITVEEAAKLISRIAGTNETHALTYIREAADRGEIQATDTIEKLQAELEQVKAERDAAVDVDKAILWLKNYVFEDSRKIYTNGARIIPYFRVLQALRDKAYHGLKED